MMRIAVSFEINQKVSSTLSILLVLFLSTLVALLVIKSAREVVEAAQSAPAFHLEKRTGGPDAMNTR